MGGRFKGSYFRFGYRIFRDTYADGISDLNCRGGVCEGMPLSNSCDIPELGQRLAASRKNARDFLGRFADVRITSLTEDKRNNDLPPEALFAGIRQALADATPCGQRIKLLFVIGDAPDNSRDLPNLLKDKLVAWNGQRLLYFIAPPRNKSRFPNMVDRFNEQATAMFNLTVSDVSSDGWIEVRQRGAYPRAL